MKYDPADNEDIFSQQIAALIPALDSVTDMGIVITDMDDVIVFYNHAAAIFDHLDRKAVVGTKYTEIYIDEDGGAIQKVRKTGEPLIDFPQEFTYLDGTKCQTVDSVYPVYIDGQFTYIISFTRYQTEIRESISRVIASHLNHNGRYAATGKTNHTFTDIRGTSILFQSVIQKAFKAARSLAPVFLEGETGTGKELFAQSIHYDGLRGKGPFVAINCAAIPENLLEGLLFGTVKGSYTGAENRQGLFEQAKGGTFFLDEINSMPMALQAKLLRVLQEKRIRRLGADREMEIDCRFIASCNAAADRCIGKGTLRSDLYYRLAVFHLEIPPLRVRKEDIDEYLEFFIERFSGMYGGSKVTYTEEFSYALHLYDWPGNVRELENVIESAVAMVNEKRVLTRNDLPGKIRRLLEGRTVAKVPDEVPDSRKDLKELVGDHEKQMILRKLEENNWNVTHAAQAMGLTRSNLQYRIRKYHIKKEK